MPWLASHATWASSIEMSTCWPSPVRCRWRTAARIATAAYIPDMRSAIETPTFIGSPLRLPGDAHDPAHRLDERVVGGPRGVWSRMPEPGHRAVDEPGEVVLEVVVPEAVLREGPGLEVLREDVAARDEPAGERLTLRVPEVEGDGPLVAVRPREVRTLGAVPAVPLRQIRGSEVAGVVARSRPLDLDDLCPEVAQDLGAARAGENASEVEDDEAVEGTVHPGVPSWCRPRARRPGFLPRPPPSSPDCVGRGAPVSRRGGTSVVRRIAGEVIESAGPWQLLRAIGSVRTIDAVCSRAVHSGRAGRGRVKVEQRRAGSGNAEQGRPAPGRTAQSIVVALPQKRRAPARVFHEISSRGRRDGAVAGRTDRKSACALLKT